MSTINKKMKAIMKATLHGKGFQALESNIVTFWRRICVRIWSLFPLDDHLISRISYLGANRSMCGLSVGHFKEVIR